jgi:hypothetical protein
LKWELAILSAVPLEAIVIVMADVLQRDKAVVFSAISLKALNEATRFFSS